MVEDEQRGPKAGEEEADEDMGGQPRSARGHDRKPLTPVEAEIWDSFKGQMAEAVAAAVQGGTEGPDIAGAVQALAQKLAALLESKARDASPLEPQVPPAPVGVGPGQPVALPTLDGLDAQKGQPFGTGRGAGVRGRAFSRSRSRGEDDDAPP